MKVRDILKVKGSQVYTIGPDQTVLDAVAILMQHRIGALLVRDATGTVSGIISERDVLGECLRRSADLDRIPVREVMTRDLVVCVPDDDVDYAMGIVTKNRVRHLPIMDDDGVAGIISIGDLVKAGLEEAEYENRYLKEYIQSR
jgi:CBS domain-containing protein